MICNSRNVDNQEAMIAEFAKRLGSQMIYFVPRDNMVQRAEINRKTVIDYSPECEQASHYRNLANNINNNEIFNIPNPMETEDLEKLLMEFGILD